MLDKYLKFLNDPTCDNCPYAREGPNVKKCAHKVKLEHKAFLAPLWCPILRNITQLRYW